jgi:cytochrome oxidase Cu insertion factor (SCO1/SenC/PrrC family)
MLNLKWLLLFVLMAVLAACSNQSEIKVGADAPDFTLQSATGEPVSLSDYVGRPVLLFFHMAVG